jgi:hypothetical protein
MPERNDNKRLLEPKQPAPLVSGEGNSDAIFGV